MQTVEYPATTVKVIKRGKFSWVACPGKNIWGEPVYCYGITKYRALNKAQRLVNQYRSRTRYNWDGWEEVEI